MSRPAEQILEFDRLKEIVSHYTTCAPGRRATLGLQTSQDAAALDAEFELVREGVAYFRAASEFGFGSLADPEAWLARLVIPGSVLVPAELLDVSSLMETAHAVRQLLARILVDDFLQQARSDSELSVRPVHRPNPRRRRTRERVGDRRGHPGGAGPCSSPRSIAGAARHPRSCRPG